MNPKASLSKMGSQFDKTGNVKLLSKVRFLLNYLEFIPALQWEISLKLLCSNTLVYKTMNYFSFANTCVSDDDDIDYDDNGGSSELSVCGCDAYDELD